MRGFELLLLALLACACTSSQKRTEAAAAAAKTASDAAAFDERLQQLSLAREHTDEDGQVKFAKFVGEATRGEVKIAALGFRFRRVPPHDDAQSAPDRFASLGATLDDAPDQPFVIGVRLPDEPVAKGLGPEAKAASKPATKLVFARPQHAAPSRAGRELVARLWGLGGERVAATYAPAVLEATVLGHKLKRDAKAGLFSEPGKGSWTLFQVVDPDVAYVAIDWEAGAGEVIASRAGRSDQVGRALLRVF